MPRWLFILSVLATGLFFLFIGAIALVVLFYAEEDWRGAHAWVLAKAKWEARGETLDYAKLIPPPVPDEENLAALPIFKLGQAEGLDGSTYPALVTFRQAVHSDVTGFEIPLLGSEGAGNSVNIDRARKTLEIDYSLVFKGQTAPSEDLAKFDALFPFTANLRAAAKTRSNFRLNMDYAVSPPITRAFGSLGESIRLSKVLAFHAVLSLGQGKGGLALDDIKINLIVARGVMRDPSLVGGLVGIGVTAISRCAVCHGLVWHEWTDSQLEQLQLSLGSLDLLKDAQFSLNSEAALGATSLNFLRTADAAQFKRGFGQSPMSTTFSYWPIGWFELNKSQSLEMFSVELDALDPQDHRVFAEKVDRVSRQASDDSKSWLALAPWNILYTGSAPALTRAVAMFAQGQVWIDETRIACALERYRLAHGEYPAALDALLPACIDALPHDIMNGEPYRYRLRPDGTFLLYSVGWNQTDDGGVEVDEPGGTRRDFTQGDWIWPTPKWSAAAPGK